MKCRYANTKMLQKFIKKISNPYFLAQHFKDVFMSGPETIQANDPGLEK